MKSLSNDGSYESRNKELFTTDKEVYLDGDVQSSSYGDVQYHEALVHPALITHPNPRRVAIIGGGEVKILQLNAISIPRPSGLISCFAFFLSSVTRERHYERSSSTKRSKR